MVLVAAGLIGLFAEKRSAELVAMQSFAEYRAIPQAESQGMVWRYDCNVDLLEQAMVTRMTVEPRGVSPLVRACATGTSPACTPNLLHHQCSWNVCSSSHHAN